MAYTTLLNLPKPSSQTAWKWDLPRKKFTWHKVVDMPVKEIKDQNIV